MAGVLEATAEHGYVALTVERILRAAGVSRASFYQYFVDLDDCFWTVYRHHAAEFVRDVSRSADLDDRSDLAGLAAVVDVAVSRPAIVSLLITESLAAAPRGHLERDRLFTMLTSTMRPAAPAAGSLDIPPAVLIGATLSFLSVRLADGTPTGTLRREILEWASVFVSAGIQRSFSPHPAPAPPRTSPPTAPSPRLAAPGASARERIIHATASAISEKGYRAVTVADIVADASTSRRHFYTEFRSKSAAFIAAYEYAFQRVLGICTPAFFSVGGWPERVWNSADAFTSVLSREPALAHLGFVECHALGRELAPRVLDTQLAFTLFLEEGFRQRPEGRSLPRSYAALTAAAIFELAFQASRRGLPQHLRPVQPLAVHIALAPFIGSDAAGAFIEGKLAARRSSRAVA
jgi:AcrR family transcriptional regulator